MYRRGKGHCADGDIVGLEDGVQVERQPITGLILNSSVVEPSGCSDHLASTGSIPGEGKTDDA